ncbi:MAG: MBL fold metallo-hydrolase [Pyrinomonadaceae bacterium]
MRFGEFRVEIVPDTEFRLDGGAMFGVVPKVLWQRVAPADEDNRVLLNMNCVYVETATDKILIETGIGEKWSEKAVKMYGISRERPLAESIRAIAGCGPEEITIVVNTHLHFDHAGGNTIRDARTGDIVPQFPNARYLVSRSEYEHAAEPHERDRASYLAENWEPLLRSGQLELMADEYEVVPGLRMQVVRGHSATMQTWRLESGGQTMYGFADLVPTANHLAPAWIMGYDLFPTETLAFKKEVLPRAVRERWLCVFYHDPAKPLCRLAETDGIIRGEAFDAHN